MGGGAKNPWGRIGRRHKKSPTRGLDVGENVCRGMGKPPHHVCDARVSADYLSEPKCNSMGSASTHAPPMVRPTENSHWQLPPIIDGQSSE